MDIAPDAHGQTESSGGKNHVHLISVLPGGTNHRLSHITLALQLLI